ncbi:scavenger receptor class F member 2-like [Mustela putorius furo]|uniref:Scavenger receptor class F member 2-like n=1 Tax=Mustela putorius furo TaxID=9669 RepID=A0A8U0SCV6_MUSPF|nr:scavenger receptor class F member 2-like [Mustela putorius furo]
MKLGVHQESHPRKQVRCKHPGFRRPSQDPGGQGRGRVSGAGAHRACIQQKASLLALSSEGTRGRRSGGAPGARARAGGAAVGLGRGRTRTLPPGPDLRSPRGAEPPAPSTPLASSPPPPPARAPRELARFRALRAGAPPKLPSKWGVFQMTILFQENSDNKTFFPHLRQEKMCPCRCDAGPEPAGGEAGKEGPRRPGELGAPLGNPRARSLRFAPAGAPP